MKIIAVVTMTFLPATFVSVGLEFLQIVRGLNMTNFTISRSLVCHSFTLSRLGKGQKVISRSLITYGFIGCLLLR